jgi:hypothetical protein
MKISELIQKPLNLDLESYILAKLIDPNWSEIYFKIEAEKYNYFLWLYGMAEMTHINHNGIFFCKTYEGEEQLQHYLEDVKSYLK